MSYILTGGIPYKVLNVKIPECNVLPDLCSVDGRRVATPVKERTTNVRRVGAKTRDFATPAVKLTQQEMMDLKYGRGVPEQDTPEIESENVVPVHSVRFARTGAYGKMVALRRNVPVSQLVPYLMTYPVLRPLSQDERKQMQKRGYTTEKEIVRLPVGKKKKMWTFEVVRTPFVVEYNDGTYDISDDFKKLTDQLINKPGAKIDGYKMPVLRAERRDAKRASAMKNDFYYSKDAVAKGKKSVRNNADEMVFEVVETVLPVPEFVLVQHYDLSPEMRAMASQELANFVKNTREEEFMTPENIEWQFQESLKRYEEECEITKKYVEKKSVDEYRNREDEYRNREDDAQAQYQDYLECLDIKNEQDMQWLAATRSPQKRR